MNNSPLTPLEINQLVAAVGGPASARTIIEGIVRYSDIVVGGVAHRPKHVTLKTLLEQDYLKDDVVKEVLVSNAYSVTLRRIDLKLTRTTPAVLGLTDGGNYAEILAAAKKFQLTTCPEDTAASMMLQMEKPWTRYGRIVVASAPIVHHQVAYLFQIMEHRLMVTPGDKGHHWGPHDNFLFRRY